MLEKSNIEGVGRGVYGGDEREQSQKQQERQERSRSREYQYYAIQQSGLIRWNRSPSELAVTRSLNILVIAHSEK